MKNLWILGCISSFWILSKGADYWHLITSKLVWKKCYVTSILYKVLLWYMIKTNTYTKRIFQIWENVYPSWSKPANDSNYYLAFVSSLFWGFVGVSLLDDDTSFFIKNELQKVWQKTLVKNIWIFMTKTENNLRDRFLSHDSFPMNWICPRRRYYWF